jgi:PilZ domain-containing protein
VTKATNGDHCLLGRRASTGQVEITLSTGNPRDQRRLFRPGLNQRDIQQSTHRSIERWAFAPYSRTVPDVSPRESSDRVDRRAAPRFPIVLAVTLEHGEGRTRDVSATGVFFTTQGPFVPGAHVKFSIELENADPSGVMRIACEGEVVRVEPRPRAVGMAVRIDSYDFSGRLMSGIVSVTGSDDRTSSQLIDPSGSPREVADDPSADTGTHLRLEGDRR